MNLNAKSIPDLPGAVCQNVDPEIFYPDLGGPTADAKAVCDVCPVKDPCLEWALVHEERHGVWGGVSARTRVAMIQERKKAALA